MQPPLVSIIITTYNGQQYLAEQLDSLLHQTYDNIEIVAVDDGSTDDSVKILKSYAARHHDMLVVQNEYNLGYIQNFDKGCRLSKGVFIALCDQDDYWHKDKIKNMVAAIGNYPMVYCDSFICNSTLEKTSKQVSDRVNCMTWTNCLQQAVFCRVYGHATLMTRQLYKMASPFVACIPHDWWLSYMAALHGGILYLNEPLVYYRQHESNLIGAVGGKKKYETEKKKKEKEKIRERVRLFYEACSALQTREKKVLASLVRCYQNFSLPNDIRRVVLFLQNRNVFLRVKNIRHFIGFCFR